MIRFLLAVAAAAAPVALPSVAELAAQIAARDGELLDVYFNRCEPSCDR